MTCQSLHCTSVPTPLLLSPWPPSVCFPLPVSPVVHASCPAFPVSPCPFYPQCSQCRWGNSCIHPSYFSLPQLFKFKHEWATCKSKYFPGVSFFSDNDYRQIKDHQKKRRHGTDSIFCCKASKYGARVQNCFFWWGLDEHRCFELNHGK